jgi:hypothetical protein
LCEDGVLTVAMCSTLELAESSYNGRTCYPGKRYVRHAN